MKREVAILLNCRINDSNKDIFSGVIHIDSYNSSLNAGKTEGIVKGYLAIYSAWRQTFLVDKRQIDSMAKDIPKLFPFCSTTSLNDKLSKMLSET